MLQLGSVMVPDYCEVCGEYTGVAYDVHMVVRHPETRPQAERPLTQPKPKKKKK